MYKKIFFYEFVLPLRPCQPTSSTIQNLRMPPRKEKTKISIPNPPYRVQSVRPRNEDRSEHRHSPDPLPPPISLSHHSTPPPSAIGAPSVGEQLKLLLDAVKRIEDKLDKLTSSV